jgi:long-chain acyl-CoA synthetase
MNIVTLLQKMSAPFAHRTAVVDGPRVMTYRELWDGVATVSSALRAIGVGEGHRVALILPNSADLILLFFAVLKANGVVGPLPPSLTACEFCSVLANLKPHVVVAQSKVVEGIRQESPSLLENATVIYSDGAGDRRTTGRSYGMNDLLRPGAASPPAGGETAEGHVATIQYTYRGIGYPLGAVLTHRNYVEGLQASAAAKPMTPDHRVLSLLHLSHIYPLIDALMVPMTYGATIVLTRNYMPRSILSVIDEMGINSFSAVPTIYKLLLQHYRRERKFDLRSLQYCISGGAFLDRQYQEALRTEMGLDILQGYGMTECSIVTWNHHEWSKAGSVGFPLREDYRVEIRGDDGELKPRNTRGEIIVRSPTVMTEYFGRPEETRTYLEDGWLSTGDYGYVDDGGYLYFTGLKKNVAKVGGNMVDLKEVESVLLSHPAVREAVVSTDVDEVLGQTIVARVVPRVLPLTEGDVRLFCGTKLSRHKVPRKVEIGE